MHLAGKGFHVFAGVRREVDGEALQTKTSAPLTPLIIDVTDGEAISAAAAAVTDVVGDRGLAGLVDDAGIASRRPSSSSRVDFPTQLEVDLFGPVAMVQAFLPLIRRGGGRIVNVGSIGGMLVLPLNGAYSASKFGLRAISDALRLELRQWNIHVSLIEVAPVKSTIYGRSYAELDTLEPTLGGADLGMRGRPPRFAGRSKRRRLDAGALVGRRRAVAPRPRPTNARPGIWSATAASRPRWRQRSPTGRGTERSFGSSGSPSRSRPTRIGNQARGARVNTERKPKVLVVYFSLTKQSARVAEAMGQALSARGCEVTKAAIEFTDERWVGKLSQFPMKHPIPQLASILLAQLRHTTGEMPHPPDAQHGDYDLVVLASPTWWFQTSMPIRSYLESPEAKTVLDGKPFACASISHRYFGVDLGRPKKLGEKDGGRWIDRHTSSSRAARSSRCSRGSGT